MSQASWQVLLSEASDATNTIKPFRAYFTTTSSASELILDFGGTTGIDSLTPSPSPKGEGSVYNLNGQRVANPSKGLYIVNGKKVVIK